MVLPTCMSHPFRAFLCVDILHVLPGAPVFRLIRKHAGVKLTMSRDGAES